MSYDEFREHDLVQRIKEHKLVPNNYIFTTVHTLFDDMNRIINSIEDVVQKTSLRTLWIAVAKASSNAFYTHIHNAAAEGNKLIVDAVVMNDQLQTHVQSLRIYDMCTIFTHITLEKLKERVAQRNTSDNLKDHRNIERVIRVYPLYYNHEGKPLYTHDIIVDTGILTPEEAAEKVITAAQK